MENRTCVRICDGSRYIGPAQVNADIMIHNRITLRATHWSKKYNDRWKAMALPV
jgi:hypothetical protein